MTSPRVTQLVPIEQVEKLIHLARGEKVLLDADLARLYGVTTGALNRAVKRNANRFPADFMFELTAEEAEILKCQSGISSSGHGGRRRSKPYVFTEQGVAMLSSVLRSERAAQVNIAIIRVFVRLRETLALHKDLAQKLAELDRRLEGHSLSASIGERARVRCRICPFRRHPPTHDPARQTEPGSRLSHQGRQRALPREKKVTMRNGLNPPPIRRRCSCSAATTTGPTSR